MEWLSAKEFKAFWRKLVKSGWKARRPRDLSVDYTYVKPGVTGKLNDAERGENYFVDLASARGPGALFREEWNTMAGNAKRHRSRLLYRMERDVNPTPTATVQRFYDPQESTNVGSQLKKKGNAVVSLKSNVPRFLSTHDNGAFSRGPGSYFPDRVRRTHSFIVLVPNSQHPLAV
ncbi:hypothetical protein AM587_10016305 [Phytophthora nicotianae]|uniref:Uncharacterized protein n=1 Tax=Phytophthora nicotianae TaxID=4792 RepID=A0A0W8D440_PHYNI|nr:hypothetical protein AM587_10016305 [Phytophthora nicotianae]